MCVSISLVLFGALALSIECKNTELFRRLNLSGECNEQEGHCCLEPLYINFQKLFGAQFKSILYPKGMDIGRCRDYSNSSHNRMSISDNNSTTGCCVPVEYMDFRVLVYEKDAMKVVFKTIPNVKISRCGCA